MKQLITKSLITTIGILLLALAPASVTHAIEVYPPVGCLSPSGGDCSSGGCDDCDGPECDFQDSNGNFLELSTS